MRNYVQLIGNLGADPETRTTQANMVVANLRVATTYQPKDKPKETEWHQVVCFGRLAENVSRFCRKGDPVLVEGRLRTRSWEDKSGGKRYTTEVMATAVQFLGQKPKEDRGPKESAPEPMGLDSEFDDIPFF